MLLPVIGLVASLWAVISGAQVLGRDFPWLLGVLYGLLPVAMLVGILPNRFDLARATVTVTPLILVIGKSSIARDEIDHVRSAHRGTASRLTGLQTIYNHSGKRLWLYRWAYSRSDLADILELTGLSTSG